MYNSRPNLSVFFSQLASPASLSSDRRSRLEVEALGEIHVRWPANAGSDPGHSRAGQPPHLVLVLQGLARTLHDGTLQPGGAAQVPEVKQLLLVVPGSRPAEGEVAWELLELSLQILLGLWLFSVGLRDGEDVEAGTGRVLVLGTARAGRALQRVVLRVVFIHLLKDRQKDKKELALFPLPVFCCRKTYVSEHLYLFFSLSLDEMTAALLIAFPTGSPFFCKKNTR